MRKTLEEKVPLQLTVLRGKTTCQKAPRLVQTGTRTQPQPCTFLLHNCSCHSRCLDASGRESCFPGKERSRQPTYVDKQVSQPRRPLLPIFLPQPITALALGVFHSFTHSRLLSTCYMPGIGYKVTNDTVLLSAPFSLVAVGVQRSPRRGKDSLS